MTCCYGYPSAPAGASGRTRWTHPPSRTCYHQSRVRFVGASTGDPASQRVGLPVGECSDECRSPLLARRDFLGVLWALRSSDLLITREPYSSTCFVESLRIITCPQCLLHRRVMVTYTLRRPFSLGPLWRLYQGLLGSGCDQISTISYVVCSGSPTGGLMQLRVCAGCHYLYPRLQV